MEDQLLIIQMKPNFTNQYVSVKYLSSLQQPINISQIRSYTLPFYYAARSSYSMNLLQIFLNSVLTDYLTSTPTTWAQYINKITITSTGNQIFLIRDKLLMMIQT